MDPPEPSLVQEFETCGMNGPVAGNVRIDWRKSMASPWNLHASRILAKEFINYARQDQLQAIDSYQAQHLRLRGISPAISSRLERTCSAWLKSLPPAPGSGLSALEKAQQIEKENEISLQRHRREMRKKIVSRKSH